MKEVLDAFLAEEDLSPEEQQVLRRMLADDPGLAEAFALWYHFQADLRQELSQVVPDRGLLVCYALDAAGHTDILSDTERQALETARPALDRALAAHPGLADVVQRIQNDAVAFEAVWDGHTADEAPRERMDRSPLVRQSPRPVAARWMWRAVLTVTLACFVAIAMLLLQRDQGMVTYETAANEVREVELADGSTVRLMEESILSVVSGEEGAAFTRQVKLQGRAFFQVARDEQPFTIQTSTARITVLGTAFGVDATEALTEVVLSTGRVALASVAAPDKMVVLQEGEMSRVGINALPATPMPVNVAEELGWTGLFLFRGTPMEAIARQLQAHYNIEIEVAPNLLKEPVTGTFEQTQRAEDILNALATTLGATVEARGEGAFSLHMPQ